jgi:hypothetical protein
MPRNKKRKAIMAKTLRIALVTVAALAAGSSAVLAQTGRIMDNDTRALVQSPPSAAARARAERADQLRSQQDLQVQPGSDYNRDGTSPRVDIQ